MFDIINYIIKNGGYFEICRFTPHNLFFFIDDDAIES